MRGMIGPAVESAEAPAMAFCPKRCLRGFLALALCFAGSAALLAQEPLKFDKAWRYCDANPECIVISGVCDEPECVNKSSSEKLLKYNKEIAPSIDCHAGFKLRPAMAVCEDHQCQCEDLAEPKNNVSKHEK